MIEKEASCRADVAENVRPRHEASKAVGRRTGDARAQLQLEDLDALDGESVGRKEGQRL